MLMDLNSNNEYFTNLLRNGIAANTIVNVEFEEETKQENQTQNPNIRTFTYGSHGTTRVVANDLRQFVKEKNDLYTILGIEGQFHLPPYDECSMEFLRDVLKGRKKLIRSQDICQVNVPRYKEFNATPLNQAAFLDPELRPYFPDPSGSKFRAINRRFLFNVRVINPSETFTNDR